MPNRQTRSPLGGEDGAPPASGTLAPRPNLDPAQEIIRPRIIIRRTVTAVQERC